MTLPCSIDPDLVYQGQVMARLSRMAAGLRGSMLELPAQCAADLQAAAASIDLALEKFQDRPEIPQRQLELEDLQP